MPVGAEEGGEARLEAFGLTILKDGDDVIIDDAAFDSPAQAAGLDFDQKIQSVLVPVWQAPKELFYIPAILILAGVFFIQRRRKTLAEA